MAIIVLKFGGTSVATPEVREKLVQRIKEKKGQGYEIVTVVSAMGRRGDPYATDTLISLLKGDDTSRDLREQDMLMSCGEIISSTIVAKCLRQSGIQARSMTGRQAGIVSDDNHGSARIITVDPTPLRVVLQAGYTPVVCGFQAATDAGEITTLGRGGSDTTAAALGVALGAEAIEVFTDVEGVMTADPRLVGSARVIAALSYGEVFQMAYEGSKVIHPRAVELAMQKSIPIVVRNIATNSPGTLISSNLPYESKRCRVVTGVACATGIAQVTINTDEGGRDLEVEIFRRIADAGVSVDLINVGPREKRFVIHQDRIQDAVTALDPLGLQMKIKSSVAKISAVGAGMRGVPGVMARIVLALNAAGIEILQTSDSHISISVLTDAEDMEKAVRALHDQFGLSKEES